MRRARILLVIIIPDNLTKIIIVVLFRDADVKELNDLTEIYRTAGHQGQDFIYQYVLL